MAYQWDSFRELRTPEWDRELERERQRLHQLQMTSPSIRKQREYNHQQPISQPDFGGPSNVPVQGRIDCQQRFEQGFQSQHALRLQNYGRHHPEPNASLPAAAGPSIPVQSRENQQMPVAGPSHIPIAGPSAPIPGPSHMPIAGPSAHVLPDWTYGVIIESQNSRKDMRRKCTYMQHIWLNYICNLEQFSSSYHSRFTLLNDKNSC